MRVYHRLSGIVGVVRKVTRKESWAAVFCLLMIFPVAVPGLASAQPDVPPTPTPIVDVPGGLAPEPAPDTGSGTPSGPAVGAPAPAPAPVPPPPPPAPAPVPAPAPAPVPPAPAPPAPVDPGPANVPPAPAPPAGNQGQTPAGPSAPSGGSVEETSPAADEPSSDDNSLPSGGTSQPNLPSGNGQGGQASESEEGTGQPPASQPGAVNPSREGSGGAGSGAPPLNESEEEGQQDAGQTPAENGVVPGEQNGNSSEGSSSSGESSPAAPVPSASAAPSPGSGVVKEGLNEPVVLPDAEPVKVNEAVKAPESEIQTLSVAKSEPAPEADQKLVDEALMATMGGSGTPTTTNHPTTTSPAPTTTKKPWPGGNDKPWECNDRGPRGCYWDGWKPGPGGNPVFTNPYKEYWQLVQWLDRLNNRHQKWVPPHSHLPVQVEDGGVFGFAILTLSARHNGVTLGVAFGAFSSPGVQCVRHPCHVPPRPTLNASFLVYIPFGPYRDRYVPRRVYDCGCEPVYHRNGRDYYRYYFEGYREVIVYKETRVVEGRPQQVIVPVEYRQTPVQQAPVPVTAGNVGDVIGIMPPGGSPDDNPDVVASPDLTSTSDRARYIAISAATILILAAALTGVVRVRRRRN